MIQERRKLYKRIEPRELSQVSLLGCTNRREQCCPVNRSNSKMSSAKEKALRKLIPLIEHLVSCLDLLHRRQKTVHTQRNQDTCALCIEDTQKWMTKMLELKDILCEALYRVMPTETPSQRKVRANYLISEILELLFNSDTWLWNIRRKSEAGCDIYKNMDLPIKKLCEDGYALCREIMSQMNRILMPLIYPEFPAEPIPVRTHADQTEDTQGEANQRN